MLLTLNIWNWVFILHILMTHTDKNAAFFIESLKKSLASRPRSANGIKFFVVDKLSVNRRENSRSHTTKNH